MLNAKPRVQPKAIPSDVTKVDGSGESKQEADLRDAWKRWADETADEAALSSLSHRIAADRDKSVTTALSCLSAATAAVAGFTGITAILSKTIASLIALASAVLTGVVAILVKSSHASEHETAAREFSTLAHDARDFSDVTCLNATLAEAQSAYAGLVAHRDKILDSVTPVPLRSVRAADTRLSTQGGELQVAISAAVRASVLNGAVGSRLSAPGFRR